MIIGRLSMGNSGYIYISIDSMKGIWDKITSHKLVESLNDNYQKIKSTIQNKYTITQLVDRIYHIDYPQIHHLKILAAHIAQQPYQFWNLSEYSYEKEFSNQLLVVCAKGQIHHLCYEFYTNSPFLQLLQAIDQIHVYLSKNKQAKVYLHCQESKIRSAVFLSCYILKHRCEGITCISDAIVKVNRELGVCLQEKSLSEGKGKYANHHLLIKNFINYQTNPKFINQCQLQLRRIVVINPPQLRPNKDKNEMIGWQQAKVYAQLRCAQQLVWKGAAQKVEDTLVCTLKIDVADEFLIVVKYVVGKQIYRMLRIQLNSNFIFEENAIIQEQNIDLSPYVATSQKVIHIKMQFGKLKGLSKLAMKAVERQIKKEEIVEKKSVAVKEEPNDHKFAVQSHEEMQQGDEDLQARIEQVMKEMEQRKLRDQAQNEQSEQEYENERQAFQVLQMSESNSPKTISSKDEPRSADNWTLQQTTQQIAIADPIKAQAATFKFQKVQSQSEEQQQDLQDYLKKLQEQAL